MQAVYWLLCFANPPYVQTVTNYMGADFAYSLELSIHEIDGAGSPLKVHFVN